MRLHLYDPTKKHEYVSRMYYAPMRKYAAANGIDLVATDTMDVQGGLICDADYLSPETILRLKESGTQIFSFNCIDSAYLSEPIRFTGFMPLINRIFMVSGVPNKLVSHATVVDDDFTIRADPRHYLYESAWQSFQFMRERGGIISLPYLIWNNLRIPERKQFNEKRPTVLFRGGGHFLRVLSYMMALRNGCADQESGFMLRDYFREDMNPQFRYCDSCRDVFRRHGNFPYAPPLERAGCNAVHDWGDKLDLSRPGAWNNRCPKSFYWLAEQFSARHGSLDMHKLATALNKPTQDEDGHRNTVSQVRFYADTKWEFSIYAAQRFWEAASVGTVNLLPKRAADQDYFPAMKEGEHFLTFGDDLSGLTADIEQRQYEHIANNSYDLWDRWIKPGEFGTNTNLLRHIFDTILTPRDT